MELNIISESISALVSIRDYVDQISSLKFQLKSLQSEFSLYKSKVKSSISKYISNTTALLQSYQQQIEHLKMVTPSQQNHELQSLVSIPHSIPSKQNPRILQVFQNDTWSVLKSYLILPDFLKLLSIPSIQSNITSDPSLLSHLDYLIKSPLPESPPINIPQPPDQQELNHLLEKYVKNQHMIGKNFEKKLTDAMPTLIRLYKSTGNNMPNQKFNSISELIQFIFPYDVLLDVMIKSTSAFNKNQGSLNEWLSFMQNLLAGLISEGSLIYMEVCELTKLKNILAEKLRKAKDQLKNTEKENICQKEELKKLKDIKEHLVFRLHSADMKIIEKVEEIQKINESGEKMQKYIEEQQSYIELLKSNESGRLVLMSEQIVEYKRQVEVLTKQKEELIDAFKELSTVFRSFGLKLG